MGVIFNTSISALDSNELLQNRLSQYHRIKKYCKSILRVNTCNFNLQYSLFDFESYKTGIELNVIQDKLLMNEYILETVLRINPKNNYVMSGLINIKRIKFLGKKCYASIRDNHTYIGECAKCPDMCGLSVT